MRYEEEHIRSVRRIVLPSGRAIDVVRFQEEADPPARELHVCPGCGSQLVQPQSWSELEDGRWELTLLCPNCGRDESGMFERAQVEMLEDRMDEGLSDLITDLQRLARANMAAEVERFVAALRTDLILPEDF